MCVCVCEDQLASSCVKFPFCARERDLGEEEEEEGQQKIWQTALGKEFEGAATLRDIKRSKFLYT